MNTTTRISTAVCGFRHGKPAAVGLSYRQIKGWPQVAVQGSQKVGVERDWGVPNRLADGFETIV